MSKILVQAVQYEFETRTITLRGGAWEVSQPSEDGKGCETTLFSGPGAKDRALAYADWLECEDLLK